MGTYSYKEQDREIDTTSGRDDLALVDGQGHGVTQTRVFMPDANGEGEKQMEEFTHPGVRFPSSPSKGCEEFVDMKEKEKNASSQSIVQICLRVRHMQVMPAFRSSLQCN